MFSPLERMIAFRYLRARRKEGFISVIAGFSLMGVTLGVAALIVVMAVMNGFQKELRDKILGFNGHIEIYSTGHGIEHFDDVARKLRSASEVTSVVPLIEGQVMATSKQNALGALVKGIRREDLEKKTLITRNLQGNLTHFISPDTILVGHELASTLGVGLGDTITLISPQGTSTVMGFVPRVKSYIIAGIFNAGMYQYDSSTIFMPLDSAQLFFRYPAQVGALEIMTSNPDHAGNISGNLRQILQGGSYRIVDWQQMNAEFFTALKVERSVMFMILALIIVVAAFNIISSLIMLVKDKQGDIAILRTMGASRGMILRIFILCGSAIGIVGTFLGFVLGISFALHIETIRHWLEGLTGTKLFDPVIYYLTQLPADVHAEDVGDVVIMSLVLALLATIYPAWKAARQDPAEALRYE